MFFRSTRRYQEKEFVTLSESYQTKILRQATQLLRSLASVLSPTDPEAFLTQLTDTPLIKELSSSPPRDCFDKIVANLRKTYTASPPGPNGRQRILSIVTDCMSHDEIQALFLRADKTEPSHQEITKAKRHAQQYGAGGVPAPRTIIHRQRVSEDDVVTLIRFLNHQDISSTSYSKKVCSVEGTHCIFATC